METSTRALLCRGNIATAIPSLIALASASNCALLLVANPVALTNVARQVFLQELLAVWRLRHLCDAWFWLLSGMFTLLNLYWVQLWQWLHEDPAGKQDWLEGVMDNLQQLPFLKLLLCVCVALLPLILITRDSRRTNLAHLMIWFGTNRWDHSEMGSAGFYLNRPYLAASSSHAVQPPHTSRSTSSISCRRSPRLRITRSMSDCRRTF